MSDEIIIRRAEFDIRKGRFSFLYEKGSSRMNFSDYEPARPEFYETLKAMKSIGLRILMFPDELSKRIFVSGGKFNYKGGIVTEVTLLGQYMLSNQERIVQKFPKRFCKTNESILVFTQDEQKIIDKFLFECKQYILGERAQGEL